MLSWNALSRECISDFIGQVLESVRAMIRHLTLLIFVHSRSTLIEVEKEGKSGGLLGADLIARGGLLRPSFAYHIALPRGIPQTRYWDMVRPLVAFVRNVCDSTFQFIRQGMRLAKTALNTRKRQEG
jgi:hypothetical protein